MIFKTPVPEFRIKINKVFIIILIWMLIGVIINCYDYFTLHAHISGGTANSFSFLRNLVFNMSAGIMGGVLGGSFLVFIANEKFRNKAYWIGIAAVTVSFFVIVGIITVSLATVASLVETGKPLFDPETKNAFSNFVMDSFHLKNMVVWSCVVALTQFFLQVNDKFGQGVLWSFIMGKYHSPREEERVFMFADLASSTTIAEKLGHKNYHNLLKDFFADITPAIIHNKGEIYQYVGDEIVISWKMKNGIDKNRCVQCYFDMSKAIQNLKPKYESVYGLVPEFKAGLHYGKVIAGEVGIIKRDITYSGDVLNTAARIQSKCNEYRVKILSSDELLALLSFGSLFKQIPIGEIELKGKGNKVALSTLHLR